MYKGVSALKSQLVPYDTKSELAYMFSGNVLRNIKVSSRFKGIPAEEICRYLLLAGLPFMVKIGIPLDSRTSSSIERKDALDAAELVFDERETGWGT